MYGALVLNFVFLFLTISLRLFEFVLHVWQATTVIVFCVLYFLRCAVAGNRRTLCVLSCRYCVAGNHHTNFSSNLNFYSCDRSIESPLLFSKPPVDVIHFIRVCNWQHSGALTGKSSLGSAAITHLVIHQENPRRISLSSTISLRPVFPDIRRSADRVYPVFHIWFHSSTGFVQHSNHLAAS